MLPGYDQRMEGSFEDRITIGRTVVALKNMEIIAREIGLLNLCWQRSLTLNNREKGQVDSSKGVGSKRDDQAVNKFGIKSWGMLESWTSATKISGKIVSVDAACSTSLCQPHGQSRRWFWKAKRL